MRAFEKVTSAPKEYEYTDMPELALPPLNPKLPFLHHICNVDEPLVA